MKTTKLLITTFLLLFIFNKTIFAQDKAIPTVTLNQETNTLDSELPFDKIFYLKIEKKSEQTLVDFKIRKRKKYGQTSTFNLLELKRINSVYDNSSIEWVDSTSKTMTLQLIIDENKIMDENKSEYILENEKDVRVLIFPLDPNQYYGIEYTLRSNNDVIETNIDKLFKGLQGRNPSDSIDFIISTSINANKLTDNQESVRFNYLLFPLDSIQSRLDSIQSMNDSIQSRIEYRRARIEKQKIEGKIIKKIKDFVNNGKTDSAIVLLMHYDIKFNNNKSEFKNDFINLQLLMESINTVNVDLKQFLSCYSNTMNFLISCDFCGKSDLNIDIFDEKLSNLLIPGSVSEWSNDIGKGLMPINYISIDKKVDPNEFSSRRTNLVETIFFIERITSFNWYQTNTCNDLKELLTSLISKKEQIDKYLKSRAAIVKKLNNYKIGIIYPFADYVAYQTGGYSHDDLTSISKGKFTVRPDLGVGFASNLYYANNTSDPYATLIPFIGFRFNLRPIDQSYSYKRIIHKNILHRSSINISYSFISITDSRTRFDLHNKLNFLVGYGFRLNNAINLSTGSFFFQRENPDPFISSKSLAAMPYIAVTVDFEILETLKSIVDALQK